MHHIFFHLLSCSTIWLLENQIIQYTVFDGWAYRCPQDYISQLWFTGLHRCFRTVLNETSIPFKIMHRKDYVRKFLHFSIEFANLFYIKLCTKIYTLIKWIEMNNGSWVSGMYTYVDFINFLDLIFNLFIYL